MTSITKLLAATAVACSMAAVAGGASAATYVDPWTTSPTGNISVVFGDNGLDIAGAQIIVGETTTTHAYNADTDVFTDTFSFLLPNGIVGFTLSSIGFAPNSSLSVSSMKFNGITIPTTNTPIAGGGNEVGYTPGQSPIAVALGGMQTLVVTGVGGADAVFSGTATFSPSPTGVVPEPASWALMIIGFGGTGALLRRRRAPLAA